MLLPCKKDIAKHLGLDVDEVKIGFASTIGDLFHAGHIAHLREAKNYCDFLIVGIVDDPTKDRSWKNKPIQSLFERYLQIASCTYADCVIPLSGEQDLKDSLLLIRPDVRFVGEEYKGTQFTGSELPDIEIKYLPRDHSFSSTDLRTRVYRAEIEKHGSPCCSSEDHVCTCKSQDKNEAVIFVEDLYKGEDPYKDIGKQDL